ncbi:hypothetical protein HY30_00700 [Hyphomonas chukchiensis]|uniref:Rhodanese domain-containing protein n=1 Tax=Hyphomonas chukchiensis TaxID=1280947 RepID=A0A062UNK4_9PROT|nr:rhodanese-like domain-containing protein [Hyphomonas chukchiensis]KCZ60885.1 hypothetical protein HY30_00700 [Hyphomonas chukchiensis]
MTLTGLDPQTAADRIKSGELKLVDIREADEYGREHIGGAISLPLSGVDTAGLTFAGISGWCGTAHVLAVMPWNRKAGSVS